MSWNEIRARAARFTDEWKDAHYEKGETQTFYNEFFEIFGMKRRRVAAFEHPVKLLGDKRGFLDLFWKGVLLVEQKSAGRALRPAKQQALDYFPGIVETDLPRYLLLSDFQTFELYDLDEDQQWFFKLSDLPQKVELFAFVLGIQKRTFKDQDPANIKASELMGELHDDLKEAGYTGHQLERYLVRLLFCLFADDTGIFEPRDILLDLIEQRTHEDGSDTGQWIASLFQVLNTPIEQRLHNLDEDLAEFPYVNGDLFAETLPIASFTKPMRETLLKVCNFNWESVSPAIFGSLFQSVMDKEQRRRLGGHYTTELNIMKLIGPLFLDGLREEFERIRSRKTNRARLLEDFRKRLGDLRFFDPACGCGNFLVIVYRELRQLELEVLEAMLERSIKVTGESRLEILLRTSGTGVSRINVDQFYGIEIEEFPARIAEVALWMMDHIMNNQFSLAIGKPFSRIPIKKSPHIHHADALEMDWNEVLPAKDCTAVLGNPPFIGSKYQSGEQRAQVRRIAALGGTGGTLDYVTAWFITAGSYVRANHACRIGFVATNSITQGEQVAQLWPILFHRFQLEIDYAHRTFAWGSNARGVAHVHVVIIGLARREQEQQVKRLFTYDDIKGDPDESHHAAITAYLFGAEEVSDRHLVVEETSRPINGAPKVVIGSKPIDAGKYIFASSHDKDVFLKSEPAAAKYIRPYVGAQEFLNGGDRWILALQDAKPHELAAMPLVRERIEAVRKVRQDSRSAPTRALANTPTLYHVNVLPDAPFLALPEVSSERRDYMPIGWLEPPVIPSNLLRIALSDDRWIFGVLTSRMHMAWLHNIGGRLKSDYRYSIGIVYNNFPWPEASAQKQARVRELAEAVLDARATFPQSSLSDLYDPDLMPPALRRAHNALDAAVDRLYRRAGFADDRERVEHLFGLYETLRGQLPQQDMKKKPRRRRV